MPRLPIQKVRRPKQLIGRSNGLLYSGDLVSVPGLEGGKDIRLIKPAARSYAAMQDAALRDGIVFKIGWSNSGYRPYSDQERIFRDRYYVSPLGTRWWKGKLWRKRRGVPAAAVPGTSNHGWGLAVDLGVELDGDEGAESISARAVQWLVDHAHTYGFSGELQSEPWHWRYFAGDDIPAAVLEYERRKGASTGGSTIMLLTHGFFTWLHEGRRIRGLSSPTSVQIMRDAGVPNPDFSDGDDYKTLRALLNEAKADGVLVQSGDHDKALAALNDRP